MRSLAQGCRKSCQQYFALLDSTLTDVQLAERSRAALTSKVAVDVLTVRHLQQLYSLRSRVRGLPPPVVGRNQAWPFNDGRGQAPHPTSFFANHFVTSMAALCRPEQRTLLRRLLTQAPNDGCAAPGSNNAGCVIPLDELLPTKK